MAIRGKMSQADRAKQFMPFAALKGYEDALRMKEKITVDKIELSEERKEVLDQKLHYINRGDIVSVVYFYEEEYLKVTGMVSRLDLTARVLKVVNTKIAFDDIYDIDSEQLNQKLNF
ncbi:hypothetical protein lbkm_1364 [Lachnospiraceae bacterium KM106-2]|nr:hypothetical protein lbkm_1364 [Lachnospiraceae bacterium KM106-2]